MALNIPVLVKKYFEQKGLPLKPALTFEDVIIDEAISDIHSRADIQNLKTPLAKDFSLNIPIVSSNMDTVTDSGMAIALARLGGMGFIHQFMPLEKRVAEVMKVKRADNTIIENPATIQSNQTLEEAKKLMAQYQISCLLVVDNDGVLVGILTSRDTRFVTNLSIPVGRLMTKRSGADKFITALPNTSNEEAEKILAASKVEKLPLIDSQGKVVGLITAKDILKRKQFPSAVRDNRGRLAVGATLRFNSDYIKEAGLLIRAGADVILLDTARAAAVRAAEATARIKDRYPDSILVVGNTSLPEAVVMLAKCGADCVKIGVGPGAGCKTQEETGVGAPQLYAITRCAAVAKKLGVSLIADGGIRKGGDLAKALVAGANVVMIGSLFAGTDESPGQLFHEGNELFKIYRGSASLEHQLDRIESGDLDAIRNPEGKPGRVPYAGSLVSIVATLLGGLRSSMSYVGASNLEEYWRFGKFIWRTKAAAEEGKPRI